MIDERDVPDILLDALTYGRTDVVVSDMDSDVYMANKMLDRLRRHKVTNDEWRFYTRSEGGQTKVIVMSPRCKDPAPPTYANLRKKPKEQPKPEPQKKSLLAEWVLTNLCSSRMLHISVVPAQDIDRLHGISNYETYMTDKVREQLGRDDVRVMVREADKDQTSHSRAYNARVIFE